MFFYLSAIPIFFGFGASGSFPKPLSKEEEASCLLQFHTGTEEERNTAKQTLILHNLRLVAYITKKYNAARTDAEELLSIGTVGLIKAILSYNPQKSIRLATYASRCIENEILMLIRANKKHKNTMSLSEPVGTDKDGNELTLMDLLFEKEDVVFEEVERTVQREKLLEQIKAVLTEREYTIICLRYALKGGIPLPQREVANVLKISRSYISRIEKHAIEKLRLKLYPEDFLD